jgi:flagellar basal-body rod modification protein FlgD
MNTISDRSHAVATALATNSSGNANDSGDTTITSTDFLTLLVTQLKNQDPTQPSDPTQYVSQLVGVNSLEQLIDINTQLTSMGGTTSSNASTGV